MVAVLDGMLTDILGESTELGANFAPLSPLFAHAQTRVDSSFSPNSPDSPRLASVSVSPPGFAPLNDADLSRLIISTAQAHGVPALAVWQWLDVGDIEALRAGDLEHIAAFPLCVASAVALGQLTPSGHALAPPPDLENAPTANTAQNRGIPKARPLGEAGMVRCGDCRNWTPPHGDGAGRCGKGVKPTLAQAPLCRDVPRYCVAFEPITGRRRA